MTPEEMHVAIAGVYFDSIITRDGMKLYQRPAGTVGYRGSDLSGWWIYERADGSLYGTNWPTAEECRRGNIDEIAARYNFPKDLNAMHEAEKYASEHLMDADQWEQFGRALEKAHPTACVLASGCDTKSPPIDYYDLATLITGLSAAQHAEAFCRTLWPERFK